MESRVLSKLAVYNEITKLERENPVIKFRAIDIELELKKQQKTVKEAIINGK